MRSSPIALLLAAFTLTAGPVLASDMDVDGKTSVTKLMASPLTVTVTGNPGFPVSLLVDLDPGPTIVNGVSIPIGFTPSHAIIPVGSIPGGGTLTLNLTVPTDPLLNDVTVYAGAVVFDPGATGGLDASNGVDITVRDRNMQLAGHAIPGYPSFQYVRAINEGATVELAVEASRFPEIVGRTGDIYIVAAKDRAGWIADPSLVDVGTGPTTETFGGGTLASNTFLIDSGGLDGDAGTGLGVGYDVVIDLNQDGTLNGDDFIDGYSDESGFYIVHDLTLPGPLAVTEVLYSGGSFLGQNTFYPTNIASMGQLKLVIVSHGNGHNYQWYDHIGNHLASYGYVVMSHENNTVPGIETASTTTLTNTDYFLGNLDTIAGGVLDGHIDDTCITWIGHSRGGEGIVRAYDRVFDGTYVPKNFDTSNIELLSSIAPTGFLAITSATPHAATYHIWVGGADADVSGCTSSDITQSFQIHDRAEQKRMSISLHGVGHGDFHNSTGSVATGPCLVGKTNTHTIMRGYLLPLVKHIIDGNLPAKDYLWRQYERFHAISAPIGNQCVVVDLQYRDGDDSGKFVIDDLQTQPAPGIASSGGVVTTDLTAVTEGRPDDNNSVFTNNPADPFNGFTYARNGDSSRILVFEYTANQSMAFEILPADQDFSDFEFLSFRAAQSTRHPLTTSFIRDTTFMVSLTDTSSNTSSISIGAWAGGIEEPYQRTSCGTGAGWANEFETVRIRLTDFLHDGSGVDLTQIDSVGFHFGPSFGTGQGRLGFDDLELTTD